MKLDITVDKPNLVENLEAVNDLETNLDSSLVGKLFVDILTQHLLQVHTVLLKNHVF